MMAPIRAPMSWWSRRSRRICSTAWVCSRRLHQLAARRPASQRTCAVGGDEHERRPRLTGERVDDTRTGIVEPVDVLDDEHRGLPGETRRERSDEQLGHSSPSGADDGSSSPGSSRAKASYGRFTDPGSARTTTTSTSVVEGPHELLDQSGLPDSWLAGHEGDGRVVAGCHLGRLDDADEARQRPDPPDHDRAHADACRQHRGGSVVRGAHEPYGTGVPIHAIRGLSGGRAGFGRSAPVAEPAEQATTLGVGHQLTVATLRHVEEEVCRSCLHSGDLRHLATSAHRPISAQFCSELAHSATSLPSRAFANSSGSEIGRAGEHRGPQCSQSRSLRPVDTSAFPRRTG